MWVPLSLERGLQTPVCTSGLTLTVAGPECSSDPPSLGVAAETSSKFLKFSGLCPTLKNTSGNGRFHGGVFNIPDPLHLNTVTLISTQLMASQTRVFSFLPPPRYSQYSTQQSILTQNPSLSSNSPSQLLPPWSKPHTSFLDPCSHPWKVLLVSTRIPHYSPS